MLSKWSLWDNGAGGLEICLSCILPTTISPPSHLSAVCSLCSGTLVSHYWPDPKRTVYSSWGENQVTLWGEACILLSSSAPSRGRIRERWSLYSILGHSRPAPGWQHHCTFDRQVEGWGGSTSIQVPSISRHRLGQLVYGKGRSTSPPHLAPHFHFALGPTEHL